MIDYEEVQLAARQHALGTIVADTGAIEMAATSQGFTRAAGSFLVDGLRSGMEIQASGWGSNDGVYVAAEVTASLVAVEGLTPASAAPGRSLIVGLPTARAFENVAFEPPDGAPWMHEQFIPGPTGQISVGPNGWIRGEPQYALHVYALVDWGVGAAARYADALLRRFTPRTAISLPGGGTLRVRTDVGPFRGQLLPRRPGWATIPVTIPMRLYATNSI